MGVFAGGARGAGLQRWSIRGAERFMGPSEGGAGLQSWSIVLTERSEVYLYQKEHEEVQVLKDWVVIGEA